MTFEEWDAAPHQADWLGVRWVLLTSGKVKRETLRVTCDDCWEPQAAMQAKTLPADAVAVLGDHPVLMASKRCLWGCCDIAGRERAADAEAYLRQRARAA